MSMKTVLGLSSLLVLLAGCGEDSTDDTGELTVVVESESTITAGLDPGDEVENIRDGWQVRFDKYIVTIGEIETHLSSDERVEAHGDELFTVDLKAVPESGLPLWTLSGLRAGRWEFYYSTTGAAHGSTRHESVSEADFAAMDSADATYLIAGTLTQTGGQSCPPASLATPGTATASGANAAGDPCYDNPTISFELLASAETRFGPCEVDEVPGFSIAAGGTQTVATTLHGDHLFFNGFPEGDEGGVLRLAQWLADSDLNLDGQVAREELEAIAPADLAEIDDRYQLGGSPITPLDTMWEYVEAQLKTQGHMNGEGECPFDGAVHDHEH